MRLRGQLAFAVIQFPSQVLGGLLFEFKIGHSVTLMAYYCSYFEAGKTFQTWDLGVRARSGEEHSVFFGVTFMSMLNPC